MCQPISLIRGNRFTNASIRFLVVTFTALSLLNGIALAEEGGSGHYLPGSMASFVDGVPPEETFIVRFNLLNYQGEERHRSFVVSRADFNQENPDTDYESGTQVHLDGTLAQHFPLAGTLAGLGVSGFYYQQVSADSGDGASFGDFKARSVGAGPVFSLDGKIGDLDLIGELKWLHEFDTKNRLEGDTVFLKAVLKF
ncbi:MAG: transporter [Candidatus Thorarchaeota archaeon]